MGKERLVVRNFGPITDLDIEIRPLTLFIGTQGSGKSTVAKLLAICRNAEWWQLVQTDAEVDELMKPFYGFAIDEYFQDDSYFSYTLDGHTVKYEEGLFKVETDLLAKDNDILYILAERNLVGNLSESLASMLTAKVPLLDPLMEYMSWFEKARFKLVPYNIPFFGVSFVKKGGRYRVELTGKGKDLPLKATSSGLQSAIPMLMIIDYALKEEDYNSFVIEEPEQNLFPENQHEVLGFITSKFWEKKNRQFIITTHSPYLLSSLNVLMLAYKLHQYEDIREQVDEIVIPTLTVNPDHVAAYSLNPNDEDGIYCKSLISEKTGMISVNELDTASIYIGDEFDSLYRLYAKIIKSKNK